MYDEALARATIASSEFARIAKGEADFLVKAMGLGRGESLLDVPCGTGRHARVFAKRGLRVTGIDLNPALVRMAKAESKGPGLVFRVGDMLELGRYREKFDAVVNLFTSFGYFAEDRENVAALKEMVAALKPGGRLAIHLIDRDWVLKHFLPESGSVRRGVETREVRSYDRRTKRIASRTTVLTLKSGAVRTYFHETRLYSKHEMVRLLLAAGMRRVSVFGDTDASTFQKGVSSHPIYVAWKNA